MPVEPGVPLFDVKPRPDILRREIERAVLGVLDRGAYILGPEVHGFEAEFARALDFKHVVAVSSGTSALEIALQALGLGAGDEVVLPTFTFIATATAVSVTGAKPVLADVDDETLVMGAKEMSDALTRRTKAVIPVHLFGHPAPMKEILALSRKRRLKVVEDCAQSHLTISDGKRAGSWGDLGAFSFYPSKGLGAAGDAGAISTGSPVLARVCRELRNCGRGEGKGYFHVRVGGNARMDEIQAAILRVKLKRMAAWIDARRAVAERYGQELAGLPLRLPPSGDAKNRPSYALYVVRCEERDALAEHLRGQGVSCGVYYPVPLHLQPAYKSLGYRAGDFPNSERASKTALALPMFPDMSPGQIERVCRAVRSFFR
ncbi:MAG TPA: DegT/DnrJ/EryC1/StrS family aminotransferase [Elusimicrobiota bacterium]|nr:DegT/DnrJ/EryC1/StrS family aminotransferase [Elusimicrobiota bacterium]